MALASSLTDAGLSPLARGTHISEQKTKPQPRFIPPLAPSNSGTVGLSPLARGTHVANRLIIIYFRFIPAGAGNTIEIVFGIYSEAVYPRWRGEHMWQYCRFRCGSGLSPLARGTQTVPARLLPGGRFIPAGAGNTFPPESINS